MAYTKEQKKEYDKKYRENNKQKIRDYKILWCKENEDKVKSKKREDYQKNKEDVKNRSKKHYKNNKEKHKKSVMQWRSNNKEYMNKLQRDRYKNNTNGLKDKTKKYYKDGKDNITDVYCKRISTNIGIKSKDLPLEMLNTIRELVKIKREIKKQTL